MNFDEWEAQGGDARDQPQKEDGLLDALDREHGARLHDCTFDHYGQRLGAWRFSFLFSLFCTIVALLGHNMGALTRS